MKVLNVKSKHLVRVGNLCYGQGFQWQGKYYTPIMNDGNKEFICFLDADKMVPYCIDLYGLTGLDGNLMVEPVNFEVHF